jgi:predicted transcriptional regulator
MAENNPSDTPNFIELAGDITIAWLQNPNVHPGVEDVPAFLQKMHAAIAGLDAAPVAEPVEVTHEPAVSVRSSVKPDHLVSLIDGKAYKTLKRHLAGHGLTPDEYRARYGLKADYPMVAESYAAQRRDIAKNLGLGRKRAVPAGADAGVEEGAVSSAADAVGKGVATPVEGPATSKRAVRKPKEEAVVTGPKALEAPDAMTAVEPDVASGVPVESAVQASGKRAARPARKAAAAALADAEASVAVPAVPVNAKPRRMARTPQIAADVASDTPADAPQGPAETAKADRKPKRAAAPEKAVGKPQPAPKGKDADAQPKKLRSRNAASLGAEAASRES